VIGYRFLLNFHISPIRTSRWKEDELEEDNERKEVGNLSLFGYTSNMKEAEDDGDLAGLQPA